MANNKKYPTQLFSGIVVSQDASGHYQPKENGMPSVWRTGKHTKGNFKEIGQVFLTENGQAVAVLSVQDLSFNKRHDYVPLQRWTSEKVAMTLLNQWL